MVNTFLHSKHQAKDGAVRSPDQTGQQSGAAVTRDGAIWDSVLSAS
jgi:hypothetical protein